MAYCTLEDILGSINEADVIAYTDDDDAGTVDTDRVTQAISAAGAMIDAHLAGRYLVPVDPVPGIITELAVDIAIYKIASRRSGAPEERREKFKDAVRFLEKVAAGKAKIPAAASATAGSGSNPAKISSSPRVFSRDSMRGW